MPTGSKRSTPPEPRKTRPALDQATRAKLAEAATDAGVGPDTVRLNANIPAAEHEALLRLATSHGKTMKEVVRLGLSLAKVALSETRAGNTIVVVDSNGTIVKQLIIT